MSEWSEIAEEHSEKAVSPSSSVKSFVILRPQSAPPQLPPSPRSRLHEILEDGISPSQDDGSISCQHNNSPMQLVPFLELLPNEDLEASPLTEDELEKIESALVEGRDRVQQGISGEEVGILGYGPFDSVTLTILPLMNIDSIFTRQTNMIHSIYSHTVDLSSRRTRKFFFIDYPLVLTSATPPLTSQMLNMHFSKKLKPTSLEKNTLMVSQFPNTF